jgi:amidase
MDELIYTSAGKLAALIRERALSSVEVIEAHLARIAQRNPVLNAVVTLDAEGALRQARAVDAMLARDEQYARSRPLHGVPLTLKDCHATAGMRTTSGHPPLADYVPEEDGTIAARLRAAGAIVLGKTNVSQLLADGQSNNPVFGRTLNPWNPERTPGGSSGGAAAAVAAGMTPLEIGSDIGGSIRMPSHCCGIYGLKPTEGRVSNVGHIPDLPGHPRTTRVMNAIGPMARGIDDLTLAFGVIAGPDGRDLDVSPVPLAPVPEVAPSQLRIAWAGAFPGLPLAADIRAAIERVALVLADAGAAVEETLPEVSFDQQLAVRARLREVVRMLLEQPAGGPPTALDYLTALHERDAIIRVWEAFFERWDALLCPVMMTTAFPHCERDGSVPVDGVAYPYALIPDYCRPFNLTGHPVVTVPIGLDRDGLPIGMQVVGRRWGDERLLGVARAVDTLIGPFAARPA